MDRRSFIESCTAGAACISAATAVPALAGDARPRHYARTLLVDEQGRPLRTAALKAQTNYLFHYPFAGTPAFLLDLGRAAPPHALSAHDRAYAWPGGVGPRRSVVAYSAICAHRLAYPTREASLIAYRKTRAQKGVQDNLIHCCSEHSQFDPARGAEVLSGPAPQPLAAVLLHHDAQADTLTAYATLGGELFNEFFRKHAAKLAHEVGPQAGQPVAGRAVVQELASFCKNQIQC